MQILSTLIENNFNLKCVFKLFKFYFRFKMFFCQLLMNKLRMLQSVKLLLLRSSLYLRTLVSGRGCLSPHGENPLPVWLASSTLSSEQWQIPRTLILSPST